MSFKASLNCLRTNFGILRVDDTVFTIKSCNFVFSIVNQLK